MIFAAGLGTRLKPLTDTIPKAMVSVGGRPLIEHTILALCSAGCDRIVVNVHHFAQQVKEFLNNHDFGVDIHISDETEQLLDTGGGIKKAAPLFIDSEPVLIHNVDILSNVDLAAFYAKARSEETDGKAEALLLVSRRMTKRYLLFDNGMCLAGWTNVETGEVKSPYADVHRLSFVQPDGVYSVQHGYHLYAFSGIHAIYPSVFRLMNDECPDKFPIMDFYLKYADRLSIRGCVKSDLRLMDVGKLETLQDAERFLQTLRQQRKTGEGRKQL